MSVAPFPPGAPKPAEGKRSLTLCGDGAVAMAAVALVLIVTGKGNLSLRAVHLTSTSLFVWTMVMIGLWFAGLYRRSGAGVRFAAPRVVKGCAGVAGALSVIEVAAGDRFRTWLPPSRVLMAVAAAAVALVAGRCAAAALRSRTGRREDRVLVLGSGVLAQDVVSRLQRTANTDFLGLISDQPADGSMALDPMGELPELCRRLSATRVVVATAHPQVERLVPVLRNLPREVVVDLVPTYFELTGWRTRIVDFDGLSLLSLAPRCEPGRRDAVKRVFDVAAASFMLLLLLPLLALCAAAIACTSGRPVLFLQERVGRDRRLFRIAKFRTLRNAPDDSADLFDAGSPKLHSELVAGRVTPVGKLLRRTSLDELPQLFNVLAGHMSMVGPRPFVSEDCAALGAEADRRFDVRPGLTGLWQVCGQHSLRVEELVRLDTYYVETWSLRNDLRILAKTPSRLRQGGGDGAAKSVPVGAPTAYEVPSLALEPSSS